MAIQPSEDQSNSPSLDDLSTVGPDATAAFEPSRNPSNPAAYASSENLVVAPRTPALDEEDEVEDDDAEVDDDLDEDDDLEDDDEEDEDLEDDDDELEDDDEDLDDDEDDDEDEEEEDEDDEEDVKPKKK